MASYYDEHLAADHLKRCYDLAPPRVRRYLAAEIRHVVSRIRRTDAVLELGCGYGRVLRELSPHCATVTGIDTSASSIALARDTLRDLANCRVIEMNAAALEFSDHAFDVTCCIQNGVSAFKVDPPLLLAECMRVTRPGGRVLLSSYAERFWPDRLAWFELQADAGLLGPIDREATGDGVIVCKDGFRATTFSPDQFRALVAAAGLAAHVEEVDESSVFCEVQC
ncbi:MAG: class I SAM-dependent methyltransferase [Phycisphaerae bacterium]|jgi:2-polyprenyl-6-hydroxyphenyl methylase/3-demethylubiquinone-9 3-methyltransferase